MIAYYMNICWVCEERPTEDGSFTCHICKGLVPPPERLAALESERLDNVTKRNNEEHDAYARR